MSRGFKLLLLLLLSFATIWVFQFKKWKLLGILEGLEDLQIAGVPSVESGHPVRRVLGPQDLQNNRLEAMA